MRTPFLLVLALVSASASPSEDAAPRFTADGRLQRPANYREWIYLSSGLGMTYGPLAAEAGQDPSFDNVFAAPAAYREFLKSGAWPEGTVLVLEVRASQSKGSINQGGHFQTGVLGVEAEVKDSKRFPGKWAFFPFHEGEAASKPLPPTASCYPCHAHHGAVDNTFVQFYPTLLPVAREKGTLRTEPRP